MARPQFTATVERPTDQAMRTQSHDYIEEIVTVSDGLETPVGFDDIAANEARIVESVSIQPFKINEPVQVGLLVIGEDGTPKRSMYGQYPEATPMQFDPGVRIGPEESQDMDVNLTQESGSDMDIRVTVGHREARE